MGKKVVWTKKLVKQVLPTFHYTIYSNSNNVFHWITHVQRNWFVCQKRCFFKKKHKKVLRKSILYVERQNIFLKHLKKSWQRKNIRGEGGRFYQGQTKQLNLAIIMTLKPAIFCLSAFDSEFKISKKQHSYVPIPPFYSSHVFHI